jgi:hypothetical protein
VAVEVVGVEGGGRSSTEDLMMTSPASYVMHLKNVFYLPN